MKTLILLRNPPVVSHTLYDKKYIDRYRFDYDGLLPATCDEVCLYSSRTALQWTRLELSETLRSLSLWHIEQGFSDPIDRPAIKQLCTALAVFKPQRNCPPFIPPPTVADLVQLNKFEENKIQNSKLSARHYQKIGELAEERKAKQDHLIAIRDKAILLLSYWYSLDAQIISRLTFDDLIIQPESLGVRVKLRSENFTHSGFFLTLPRFPKLCAVRAMDRWLHVSGISQGPLFRTIDGDMLTGAMTSAAIASHLRERAKRIMTVPEGKTIQWSNGVLAFLIHNGWQPKELRNVFRQHSVHAIGLLASSLRQSETRDVSPPISRTPKILAMYETLKASGR